MKTCSLLTENLTFHWRCVVHFTLDCQRNIHKMLTRARAGKVRLAQVLHNDELEVTHHNILNFK